MNEPGIILAWCALQVTVVTTVAAVLYAAARRLAPASGPTVTLTALLVIVGVSALAFSPWPRWTGRLAVGTPQPTDSGWAEPIVSDATDPASPAIDASTSEQPTARRDEASSRSADTVAESTPAASLRESLPQETEAPSAKTQRQARWPAIVAVVFLAGAGIGLLRLLSGTVFVWSCRRLSRPVTDAEIVELTEALRVELGCRRSVELRESGGLITAATVGWRRPVILLPADWLQWTDAERRAVLAHELAHVRRRDFPAWIAAQLGVVLHFYHPLVHWLAGRLRLEQELAADALAAEAVGGRQTYLTILAELALRQADRPVAWPARTFLPTGRTFLRRVAMLRNTNLIRRPLSKRTRLALVGTLLAVGGAAAGLRSLPEEADGRFLPDNNRGNRATRELREDSVYERIQELKREIARLPDETEREQVVKELKMIAKAMLQYYEIHGSFPPSIITDGNGSWSWRVELLPYLGHGQLFNEYRTNERWDSPHNRKLLDRMPDVYRHPSQPKDSTTPGYFALTGGEHVIHMAGADSGGTRISELTDGASKTITIVEAERNVPWTKPWDIVFGKAGQRPELGGFRKGTFAALFADGSVRFLPLNIEKAKLHALVTKAGIQTTSRRNHTGVEETSRRRPEAGTADQRESGNVAGQEVESNSIHSVAYSPDGKLIAGGSFDNTVKLWDAGSGKLVRTLEGHDAYVRTVEFSPEGKLLASAGDDETVRLWDPETGDLKKTLKGHGSTIPALGFTPNGHILAVADRYERDPARDVYAFRIRLWNVGSAKVVSTLPVDDYVTALAISPDGERLAVGLTMLEKDDQGGVRLFDLKTHELLQRVPEEKTAVYSLAFSPGGDKLAVALPDNTVSFWNLRRGRIVDSRNWGSIGEHTDVVWALGFSPDGNLIATGGTGPVRLYRSGTRRVLLSEFRLWDARTGKLLHTIQSGSARLTSLDFSPDGETVVFCDDAGVRAVDVATGKIVWRRSFGQRSPRETNSEREDLKTSQSSAGKGERLIEGAPSPKTEWSAADRPEAVTGASGEATTTVAVRGDDGTSDRQTALRDLQLHRTAASLNRLLALNNDTTSHIEKLGHPTDSAGIKDVATIQSAGVSYVAVAARRYPPEVKYPFGKNGIGVGFLFDSDGNLKARFGGELGPDGVNGDEVHFTTLGTSDRWFVRVHRFQKKDGYSKRSDVFLVEPTFPLAFRVWHNGSVGWTTKPYSSKDDLEFSHFYIPGGLDLGGKGQGADGESYHLIIGWDADNKVFRGPSRITHSDSVVFAVDLDSSKRFIPVDRDDTK